MHPFNQNFNRGGGARQQGYDRNDNFYNRGRNLGQCRNQFPIGNNSQYGGNANVYRTDMYGNADNRQCYRGDQSNFNPQRQFRNQQFHFNQPSQNDCQNIRQMRHQGNDSQNIWQMGHQRSRSYPDQPNHLHMQQNSGQYGRLRERQSSFLGCHVNSQEESRRQPLHNDLDHPRERANWNFQNERQNVQQGNFGRQFNDDDARWQSIKPQLFNMMEKYFHGSRNFLSEQRLGGNFHPYVDQTSLQNVASTQRHENKNRWRKSPYGLTNKPDYSQSSSWKQNQPKQESKISSKFLENCKDESVQNQNKMTGMSSTVVSAEDVPDVVENTPAASTTSDLKPLTDHSPQSHSEDQKTGLKDIVPEIEEDSNSVNMVSEDKNENCSTTMKGDSKVMDKKEPHQNPLLDTETESNQLIKKIQQMEVQSPKDEHLVGKTGHKTQIPVGQSQVEKEQHGTELVSLVGNIHLSQDSDSGSPQQSNLLKRPPNTERNKPISPGMKDRKQLFGSPLQKTGLGRGKDNHKSPEPGKTWSANDYFTGVEQISDKQPSIVEVSSHQSTTSGGSDTVNKTPSPSGNKDLMLGQRISVIGERSGSGKQQEGRDGKWNQGRNSDVSRNREGNVEPQERRNMWQTTSKGLNRAETDKKSESGMSSSPNIGLTYKDKSCTGDRRHYNNPIRSQDQDSQRFYGSPQYDSPRGRQDFYSRDRNFDRNRGQHYRNSREEYETGSRWRNESEYNRSRDTGNISSPHGRKQGQYSSGSDRSYNSGRYQNDYSNKTGRSSSRDSADGSDQRSREKIDFNAGSMHENTPDKKRDQIIPKSVNASKEHSSQSSASFQKADQGVVRSTPMDQDPNTSTEQGSVNESNCRTSEQNIDEARKKSKDKKSTSDFTVTGQNQDSQIEDRSDDNKKVVKEIAVSGLGNQHGKDNSTQSRSKEQQEIKTPQKGTDQQGSNHVGVYSGSKKICDSSDGNKNKSQSVLAEHMDHSHESPMRQHSREEQSPSQARHSSGSGHGDSRSEETRHISNVNKDRKQYVLPEHMHRSHESPKKQYSSEGESPSRGRHSYGSSNIDPRSNINKDRKQGVLSEHMHHSHRSPKRQHEGESPSRSHHSSGSSQGRGSQRETDKIRNRNSSGGSTHSSDTGRPRSHSRDKESHMKWSHNTHGSEQRQLAREKSSDSNFNSDSSTGSNHIQSHSRRSKGDKSNSHKHRHKSREEVSSNDERKEPRRQKSKEMGTTATGQSTETHRDVGQGGSRYSRLSSVQEQRKADKEYAGGSDVDIDEEDSDDELETPFFLRSLTEASSRPIPSTPTKGINVSYTESPTPSCSPQISLGPLSSFSSGFSLDALLAEAIDKTSEERQCEDMHAELEEGLRKGGFVKDTLEVNDETAVDGELLPEHQLKLKKFEICKSQMSEVHPGESIFLGQRYQCLFNSSISLQSCGFVPGTTYIDKHLITVQPGDYITLLTSDIMLMCFDAISCQDAVLRWLLFIMSVHPSHLLINCCYKTIQEHLHSCQHFTCKTKYTWSPAVTDILSIFCNYGADPNKLLPKSVMPNTESIRKSLFQQQNMEIQPANGKYNRENLRLVLSSLAMAFQIRPKYTGVQITQMVVMFCKAALDKSLNNFMLTHEFEIVLASLLKLYSEADWNPQSLILCRELSILTEHHHNQVYLAQLLPPTTKGNFLQRRVSFLMIHQLFNPEHKVSDDMIMHFQLSQVHNVLPRLQGLADNDIYLLSSCVSLLDLCIGNSTIKSVEKDDLEYITEQMKKMTGEVRDNVQMLDKTRIKDMMIRITSKWTLVLRSIASKQRTLFECPGNFRKSPAEMKIETVDASQTDQASETEEEEEDSRSDEEDPQYEEDELGKPRSKIKTVTVDGNRKDVSVQRMDVGDEDDLPEL